jgi:hypothetical protein
MSRPLRTCAILLTLSAHTAFPQEAVMEEVRVEATFDLKLEPPRESAVQMMIERLTLRAETQRALELQIANRSPLATLFDLTKYSPISLGASENRVDTFFLQNYMRADLNPSERNPLFLPTDTRTTR